MLLAEVTMSAPMTPAQAGVLFAAFQTWSADAGVDEASDRELAVLVLYPDGTGGIALDTPPGERPPTTWSAPDANVLAPQKAILDVHWLSTEAALAAFGSPPTSTSPAELLPDHAAALRACALHLAARDRLSELERLRNLCRCSVVSSSTSRPCWQVPDEGDPLGANGSLTRAVLDVIDAVHPPKVPPRLCSGCARRQDLTSRMRESVAACGAAGREVRRHLGALGLLVDVDVDAPPVARAPRRRTRRAAR